MSERKDVLRKEILSLVKEFYKEQFNNSGFIPGKSSVPISGKVFDENDIVSLVDSSLDFWLTAGRFSDEFEEEFAKVVKVKYAMLTNSGSSANLLALSALTSLKLKDRRLKPKDEVITVAAGFPTTLNPILQNGLVPVFVDIHVPTYNIDANLIENAISEKTKAIMIPHTLGNPFNICKIKDICEKNNLWLIEDACDALGSLYNGKPVGSFGDISAFSFYPAHHITMGEGGCVVTSDPLLKKIIESFRDWGRDCWCKTGYDDSCNKRFSWKLGDLPYGYDHKYIYSHIGYNLKVTDMQAALGVSQLKKLDSFINSRIKNFNHLYEGLKKYNNYFILPEAEKNSQPSWFGFPVSVKESAPFTRNSIAEFLVDKKIGTRFLFGGNLIRQPAYTGINYRLHGNLKNSDFVMNNFFWIGVYPGINEQMADYILECVDEFIKRYC